jgi:branched-chain amino acid transport system substrate-binding protein
MKHDGRERNAFVKKHLSRSLAVAGCVVAATVVAACGSSSSSSSSSSTGTASSAGTNTSTTSTAGGHASGVAVTQATINTALGFTGGKAGKADPSLAPVTIGYVNEEGTAPSFTQYHGVTTAAVNFVNNYLGGIDGHPLRLDACIMQSEEDGQRCGSNFRDNKNIHVAILGLAVVGNASFYKTVAGTFPTIVDVSAVAQDGASPMVYDLDGGGPGVLNAEAEATKAVGAKSVALLTADNPAGRNTAYAVQEPRMKQLGIHPTVVLFPDTATTPQFVSSLTNSGAESAGAVAFNPSVDAQCNQLHDSLATLGIKTHVITNVFCAADDVVDTTGKGLDGWEFSSFGWNPRVPGNPQSDAYVNVMAAAGEPQLTNAGYTFKSFADVMAVTKFANQLGFNGITSAAMNQAIKSWQGPGWMVPGPMRCGYQKVEISICGTQAENSTYVNGEWKNLGAITEPGG